MNWQPAAASAVMSAEAVPVNDWKNHICAISPGVIAVPRPVETYPSKVFAVCTYVVSPGYSGPAGFSVAPTTTASPAPAVATDASRADALAAARGGLTVTDPDRKNADQGKSGEL